MAKYNPNAPTKSTTTKKYPSEFGSHSIMIDEEETKLLNNPDKVVLRDEKGLYTTDKNKVDSGLADVNRYGGR